MSFVPSMTYPIIFVLLEQGPLPVRVPSLPRRRGAGAPPTPSWRRDREEEPLERSDPAASGSPAASPSLLAFARPGRALLGSEWPRAPAVAVSYFTGYFDAYAALDGDGLRAGAR